MTPEDLCRGGQGIETADQALQKQSSESLKRGLKTLHELVESKKAVKNVVKDQVEHQYQTVMTHMAEFLSVDTSDEDSMNNFMSVFPTAVTYLHKGCMSQITQQEATLFLDTESMLLSFL